jgi:uncharacterized membrane protein
MNPLLAHTGQGLGANEYFTPWELHPILIHFPICFLIGGVFLSLYARWTGRLVMDQLATGFLIAGVITGLLAAATGLLAFFTLPEPHTENAHQLMYWHLGLQAGALILYACAAWWRWRQWQSLVSAGTRLLGLKQATFMRASLQVQICS